MLPEVPMLDGIAAFEQSRSVTLSIVIVPMPDGSALATSIVNSVPASAVVPQGWPNVTPSAAYWPPPRSRTWSVVGAPSEPRNAPIWTLPLPAGSDRFAERVNTTLKPSMLVALVRLTVTGNVALACVLLSTLEGAPTLTTACAHADPASNREPAAAVRQARVSTAKGAEKPAAVLAAMRNPPVRRRRGDTATIALRCGPRAPRKEAGPRSAARE